MAGSIFKIHANGDGTQIAVGANGLIIVSTDGGATWVTKVSNTTEDLYGVSYGYYLGDEAWVAVGASGTIVRSLDTTTWVPVTAFTSEDLYDVAYGGVFLAIGTSGTLGLSNDLGSTWAPKNSGTSNDLISISVDLGAYLIVGENDTIITGTISTLQLDMLALETFTTSGSVARQALLNRTVTEETNAVSEGNWVHDALGAGTTLTVGGADKSIFITESVIGTDDSAGPTGVFHHTVTDDLSMLDYVAAVRSRVYAGGFTWPLFSAIGQLSVGKAYEGSIIWPLFTAAGEVRRQFSGDLIWPLFGVSGYVAPLQQFTGEIIWPLYQFNGGMASTAGITDTTNYVVWVINTDTKAHSTYDNFLVTSQRTFNSVELVATADGLFELTGEDDAGTDIDAKVYWVPSALGTSKQKKSRSAFVNIRAGGQDFKLVAFADEVEKRIYGQDMTGFPSNMHRKRVEFTRNLEGQIWQYGVENTDGSRFSLSDIEIDYIPGKRRLK